ncbi:hypothetical protein SeMB42_g06499 [Synchytrium endobioticum]|uniref:Uncharacterized protein n=1 Tax=Synchytrium endobioticum TaxID=286115 RepID=A0A507C7P6_9FUNG|nr:hypothetical protein SeLEV6574_g08211 [Synchytrium endobioticum]TPX39049.1 hypothetical protein SeMB42_g06499 [Synchytrium endobioticum]
MQSVILLSLLLLLVGINQIVALPSPATRGVRQIEEVASSHGDGGADGDAYTIVTDDSLSAVSSATSVSSVSDLKPRGHQGPAILNTLLQVSLILPALALGSLIALLLAPVVATFLLVAACIFFWQVFVRDAAQTARLLLRKKTRLPERKCTHCHRRYKVAESVPGTLHVAESVPETLHVAEYAPETPPPAALAPEGSPVDVDAVVAQLIKDYDDIHDGYVSTFEQNRLLRAPIAEVDGQVTSSSHPHNSVSSGHSVPPLAAAYAPETPPPAALALEGSAVDKDAIDAHILPDYYDIAEACEGTIKDCRESQDIIAEMAAQVQRMSAMKEERSQGLGERMADVTERRRCDMGSANGIVRDISMGSLPSSPGSPSGPHAYTSQHYVE